MIFPETQRIIYVKNPLDEVICQLRFPPLLKMEKDIPYDFQELVRSIFPEFVESEEIQIPISGQNFENVPPELFELARHNLNRKNYSFLSDDSKWKVNLTRDFITLSTVNYSRWEVFRERFSFVIECFIKVYNPSYFSRVGLRYKDIIRRSKLGLTDMKWSELLQPAIIGLLGDINYEDHIDEQIINTILDLEYKNSKVRIQNGLLLLPDGKEKGYLIDSDFFIHEKINYTDVLDNLDNFHECASRLIRWCITEKLHNAMEPQEL